MNIVEERINQLIENSRVKSVVRVFTEYFGEELVDYNEIIYSFVKDEMISYSTIHKLISDLCRVKEYSNIYEIEIGTLIRNIDKTEYDQIKDKGLDCFPEDLIDIIDAIWKMHNYNSENYIIVRFPRVTVTNEHGKHVDIQELYAKMKLNSEGILCERFELIRSYYPLDQWYSDYCHSHISHISTDWMAPCTGTGPINSTMDSLMNKFDENMWGLFCYELDKFVKVESLAGVPYRRLESIGTTSEYPVSRVYRNDMLKLSNIDSNLIKNFIKELIETNTINIAFVDNRYVLGDTFEKFWIKVSKAFAIWYNRNYKEGNIKYKLKYLLDHNIIRNYIIRDGKVYSSSGPRNRDVSASGTSLFIFKGNIVTLKIEKTSRNTNFNATYLLSMEFVSSLIHKILIILNYNYGRQNETTTEEKSNIERRTFYI